MADIHPSAIVEDGARLADDVRIGPYCIVGAEVALAAGVVLEAHAVVAGRTRVGAGTHIYPFASIGHKPQDLKYRGESSELAIGENNQIREYVTMNPGTSGGGMVTTVGHGSLFMVGAHVAHDCRIGDGVVMANNATLAGHVTVEDRAIIGGLAAVHQFVRIGRHAIVGGVSAVVQDVIPYGSVTGDRAHLVGLNLVGLKRHGVSREDIRALRNAYRLLFAAEGTLTERLSDVDNVFGGNEAVDTILSFMRAESSRGLCQPRDGHAE